MRTYRTDLNCYFYTFGCKVNTCETAGMQSLLQSAGYTVVSQPEEADIFLFNSCTVTASGTAACATPCERCAGNTRMLCWC